MSDLLARLIAIGTPADLVAEVAMEIARADVVRRQEAEEAARKEKKRADTARRQREFKARNRQQVTQDNAGNALPASASVTDVALSLSPNDNNSNPHTHTHRDNNHGREAEFRIVAWLAWLAELTANAKPRKPKPDGIKPHPMPADWQPGALPPKVAALADLWPPGRLEREAEACRDYWLDRPTEKRPGWDRTFHNRIRDIHDRVLKESRNDRSQNHRGSPARPRQPDGAIAACDRVLDDFGAFAGRH